MTMRVIRTAVADYGDEFPGVLTVYLHERGFSDGDNDHFLSIGNDNDSIVVGTEEQAKQLIEALQAGIREAWDKD